MNIDRSAVPPLPSRLHADAADVQCRPVTADWFTVDRVIGGGSVQVDVRNFGWARPQRGRFVTSANFLNFALMPRSPGEMFRLEDNRNFAPNGDVTFMPTDTAVGVRAIARDYSFLSLSFSESSVRELMGDEGKNLNLSPHLNIGDPRIRLSLIRMANEIRNPGVGHKALIEGLALCLVVDVCRNFAEEQDGHDVLGRLFDRVIEMLHSDLSQPPTISQLATDCGISTRQLMRSFKARTGKTIGAYLSEARIRAARSALTQGEMIKVVAAKCGFASASAFCSAFRRETGMSPKAFRAAHRN